MALPRSAGVGKGWPIATRYVAGAPTLSALTVSPNTATVGTPYTGTVTGNTAGSTLVLSGAGSAGLSISGATITGTPTSSGPINITETLAGATNSPNVSNGVATVASGSETLAVPAGYTAPTNEVTVVRNGTTYTHNYNPANELPATYDYTIYVKPGAGSDSSTTPNNPATPYNDFNKAWLMVCSGGTLNAGGPFTAGMNVQIVTTQTADFLGSGSAAGAFNGGNSVTIPVCNVFVRNTSGKLYEAVNSTSSATPVWALIATGIYKNTQFTTAATADQLFDFDANKRWYGVHPRTGVSVTTTPQLAYLALQLANAADETSAISAINAAMAGTIGAARVATTAAITLSGTQTIDGVAVVAGDRVLVKNQPSAIDNGVYVVASGAWTRATDYNDGTKVTYLSKVQITAGSTYTGLTFVMVTTSPVLVGNSGTLNATPIVFQPYWPWCLVVGTGVYYKSDRDLTVAATGATVRLSNTTSVGVKASRTGGTVYLENMRFYGGLPTAFSTLDNTAAFGRIISNSSVFQGSAAADTFSVTGKFNVFIYKTASANSYGDTSGGHAVTAGSNQQPNIPHIYEIDSIFIGAGIRHPAGTNNGSSMHDGAYVTRINSVYYGGSGRVVGDTLSAQAWNIGGCVGPSLQDNTDDYNLACSANAMSWNEGFDIVPAGTVPAIQAMQVGAQLLFRNSPVDYVAMSAGSAGTIGAYS